MVAQMEGSFAEELYSETLKLSKIELGPASSSTAITGERDFHGMDINLIDLFCNECSKL